MGRSLPWALGIALLLAPSLGALEVREIRWGFDGNMVLGAFNPVTVTFHNNNEQSFDGPVKLRPEIGFGSVGAPLEQHLFLSPGATKRLQFFPHVRDSAESWVLVWGRRPTDLLRRDDPVPLGHPAQIALQPRHLTVFPAAGVRTFPEELFPRSVSGLDGLGELLLVVAPQWDPRQERALLDWVRGGGVLHLAGTGATNGFRFEGALAVLNGTASDEQIGAGILIRHPGEAAQLSPRALGWKRDSRLTLTEVDDLEQRPLDLDLMIIERLGQLSEVDHNWGAIYLLSFLYLLLVVPVNMFIGKRVRDYRIGILCLLAGVGLFSFLMFMVGQRGYGETARVYSVVCAEVLGEGRYDLTRWAHAFVTSGGDYSFAQKGAGQLYGTVRRVEEVNGVIRSGDGGGFLCAMPLFSSRDFIHRGPVDGKSFIDGVIAGGPTEPTEIQIAVSPDFPRDAHGIWLLAYDRGAGQDRLRRMVLKDGILQDAGPAPEDKFITPLLPWYGWQRPTHARGSGGEWRQDVLKEVAYPLAGQRAGMLPTRRAPGHDRFRPVHLLVHADLPDEFKVQGAIGETGHVIYHQVLEFNEGK